MARRKLHQVYGAYATPEARRAAARALESLPPSPPPPGAAGGALRPRPRAACLDARAAADSRRCFADVLAVTGPPRSVVDLGCGLGAFALPWMGLPREAAYLPIDIDTCLADLTNRLLALLGRPPTARCLDLLGDDPLPEADVALLLKVLPCLERQERGAAASVLARIRCRAAVISYPLASLGGHERGMRASYDRAIRELLPSGSLDELAYPGEVFYVWRRVEGGGG